MTKRAIAGSTILTLARYRQSSHILTCHSVIFHTKLKMVGLSNQLWDVADLFYLRRKKQHRKCRTAHQSADHCTAPKWRAQKSALPMREIMHKTEKYARPSVESKLLQRPHSKVFRILNEDVLRSSVYNNSVVLMFRQCFRPNECTWLTQWQQHWSFV